MAEIEKTALEIILELPSILKKIENKIDVLDTNLKILNTKINKIKNTEQAQPVQAQQVQMAAEPQKEAEEPLQRPMAMPGPIQEQPQKQQARGVSGKLVLGSIKVFSKIKTASGKPVDGMTINIFDKENDLIRNLITDKDGYWECKLPSGRYSIEMIHPKLKTINKEFELAKDIKIYEVV